LAKDEQLLIVLSSTEILKKAIEADSNYAEAYYFLSAYYFKEALLNCNLYNQKIADSLLFVFRETLAKARKKGAMSEFLEYNEDLDLKLKDLSKENEMDCELWRRIVDSFIDYEKDREKRQEDFSDYLYYGRTPKYLKDALESKTEYSPIKSKPDLSSSSLFAHTFLATTMNNTENEDSNPEIKEFQKIEYSFEFEDGWIPIIAFYWSVPNLIESGKSSFLQAGVGYWHFYVKKIMGTSKNSFLPSYVFGFFNGLSEKTLEGSNMSYMVDILFFDNDKYEPIEKTLGLGLSVNYKLFKSVWMSSHLSYYSEEFIQFGVGIGIMF